MSKLAKALTAAAGNAGESLYVEDVFSTYLYTGNGSTSGPTITTGLDYTGTDYDVMLWTKSRDTINSHWIVDTVRGLNLDIRSDQTAAESNNDAFTGANGSYTIKKTFNQVNQSTKTYASWTFRKAEKFFDVVTYTGTGSATTISHNLGSVPGMVIVKRTDSTAGWFCWNRNLANNQIIRLDSTDAAAGPVTIWNNTAPTSTVFSVGNDIEVNASGGTYVAYLFAHDAGGFGDNGSESIIKCGSYSGTSANGNAISLGWEPQWLLIKRAAGGTANWLLYDSMRGLVVAGNDVALFPNLANADTASGFVLDIGPDGFTVGGSDVEMNATGNDYIYIAIRRGPMKTPESASEVFDIVNHTGNTNTNREITSALDGPDMVFLASAAASTPKFPTIFRLTGGGTGENSGNQRVLYTTSTGSETSLNGVYADFGTQSSVTWRGSSWGYYSDNTVQYYNYFFRRAPGFLDVVCYTGDGVAGRTVAHNLGVVPEMIIVKARNVAAGGGWATYNKTIGNNNVLQLQSSTAAFDYSWWNDTTPTADVFTVNNDSDVNGGFNYIAILFATLDGISKVGSYTGTAADLNVDCGFSAGARFILIKRTDSTGDWYLYDSVRGIVAGNDPYLLLNSTAAQVTSTDYIDPLNAGFTVTSSAPAALNASGGTYIFLAIA